MPFMAYFIMNFRNFPVILVSKIQYRSDELFNPLGAGYFDATFYIELYIHAPFTTISNQEIYLHDFRVILTHPLHNY